jgi:hypothetical protein
MATAGQMAVCEVCGAQFLRQGSKPRATTCSAACWSWLRLKNKGQEEQSRADALRHERKRAIAKKDKVVSGSLSWIIVWTHRQDGGEYRDHTRSRWLALKAACDLIDQHHTVQRIEGPDGVIIGLEKIEHHCRARPARP